MSHLDFLHYCFYYAAIMDEEKSIKSTESLCAMAGYSFKDYELLLQAFRHPSYVYEKEDPMLSDNQRLEFLGDAVINLVVSHILMETFPEMKEGDLSKYRAFLVSEAALYRIARMLDLGSCLLLGKGEERTNGREKPSILADAFEAFIGAVYLDGGFSNATQVITLLFEQMVDEIGTGELNVDFKTELQELSQKVFQTTPDYRIVKNTGPDHNKTFFVEVSIKGGLLGKGMGKSKKEAEQNAAKEALACLKE
jgi:ribonuclease III